MKFCFAVCEYDPLHLGHSYHISQMKNAGFDAVVVIMSGNFTQRGEIAVLDKYTRARHAILSGADLVIELPTVFSVAPAEIFASGAVKIINALGGGTLCFGSEMGTSDEFYDLASALLDETKEFKEVLKQELSCGAPFAEARAKALARTKSGLNLELLNNPNCILGVEYTKSILSQKANIQIMPIRRVGSAFKDKKAQGEFCSSSAIRSAISQLKHRKIKKYVPDFVFEDLPKTLPDISEPLLYSLLKMPLDELADTLDCSEGLENRIKVFARSAKSFGELIDRLETRRYTRARLSRVVTTAMLGINRQLVDKAFKGDTYAKVLAVNKDSIDIFSHLDSVINPKKTTLIKRKTDVDMLSGVCKKCFDVDVFALDIFNLVTGIKSNEYDMKIVQREIKK